MFSQAKEFGYSQKLITAYECTTRYPPAEKLPEIANALGVTINDLYGIVEAPQKRTKIPKIWKRVEQIEKLPETERRTLLKMIDVFLSKP